MMQHKLVIALIVTVSELHKLQLEGRGMAIGLDSDLAPFGRNVPPAVLEKVSHILGVAACRQPACARCGRLSRGSDDGSNVRSFTQIQHFEWAPARFVAAAPGG